jgi:hypothetical protein
VCTPSTQGSDSLPFTSNSVELIVERVSVKSRRRLQLHVLTGHIGPFLLASSSLSLVAPLQPPSLKSMLPDLTNDQLIALCQQRGLSISVAPAGLPPSTSNARTDPVLGHNDASDGNGLSEGTPSPTSNAFSPSLASSIPGTQHDQAATDPEKPTTVRMSHGCVVSNSDCVQQGPISESSKLSCTMPSLNTDVPRRHPLQSSRVPTSLLKITPNLPPSRIPAHMQLHRRTKKRKHHEIHSGTEGSAAESTHPQEPPGVDPLLARVKKLHGACTALPVPDLHIIVGSIQGGKVQDLSMHLAKRDALIAELADTLLEVTQELTERVGALEVEPKANTPSMVSTRKGGGLTKKRKVQMTILEQGLTDSMKVRTK